MKNKFINFVFAVILFVVIVPCCQTVNVKAAEIDKDSFFNPGSITVIESADEKGIKMGTGKFVSTTCFGYDGKSKYGRNVRVDILAEGKREGFKGKFCIQYLAPAADETDVVTIQKSFSVKAEESKMIQFAMPYMESGSITKVTLYDENGEKVSSHYNSLSFSANDDISQIYMGILSDNKYGYKYITRLLAPSHNMAPGDDAVIYTLDDYSITGDARMLDSLDVIIIDGYNSGKISSSQAKGLKDWVMEGGTLLLGGGKDAVPVFKALAGDMFKGSTGKEKTIKTDFGIKGQKKRALDILQTYIEDADTVLADGKENLISQVQYGKGNVLVAEFPLELEEEEPYAFGSVITDIITKSLSQQRKSVMGLLPKDTYNGYDSALYMEKTMLLNESGALPNIKLYAVIIFIYVFIAGPGVYLIAKKKDKRSRLWVIVPAVSAAFSSIVYLLGTSTRIQEPYINFASTLELPVKRNTSDKVNTTFSVTSPFNGQYEIPLPEDTKLLPVAFIKGNYYTQAGMFDNTGQGYGVEYDNNGVKAVMDNLPAFDSAYFNLVNERTSKGTIKTEVKKDGNSISGTIRNDMSCGLEDCIFYHAGRVYYIGSLAPGETADITLTRKPDIYEESSYGNDFGKLIEDVMGGSMDNYHTNNVIKRKIGMIMTFVGGDKESNTWFYGFIEDGGETGFSDLFRYKSYGETGVYQYTDIV